MANVQKIGNRYILNFEQTWSQFEHEPPATEGADLVWTVHAMPKNPPPGDPNCYSPLSIGSQRCRCGKVELRWQYRALRYLVEAPAGPGFASPEAELSTLEGVILPMFDALHTLEAEKRIVAGGVPIGDRAFVFIAEASSHEEVDQTLRRLPAWGHLTWRVTALQRFEGRADQERETVNRLRGKPTRL